MLTASKTIIYDPLSWIHPKHFVLPERFNKPRCRSVINDVLLRRYQLPVGEIDLTNSRERFLVSYWSLLPRAAFMVASQRHRAMLAHNGFFASLDKATRQFALAELTHSRAASDKVNDNLLWQSACEELEAFAAGCSRILRARVALLCPPVPVTSHVCCAPAEDNEFLLRMAVQNAKRAA